MNKLSIKIETEDAELGFINFKNVSWARKKSFDDILKLTNLAENYSVNELVDSCLSKNSKNNFR